MGEKEGEMRQSDSWGIWHTSGDKISGMGVRRMSTSFRGMLFRGGLRGGLRVVLWGRTSVSVEASHGARSAGAAVGGAGGAPADLSSMGLWPTFSNSSVSVSDSTPLKQFHYS